MELNIINKKMDHNYLDKLVDLFNRNRRDGKYEIDEDKMIFIFEVEDNHLVIADIYDGKIHVQYDFYDDTLIERKFEEERLKSEMMEKYSGSEVVRSIMKKYEYRNLEELLITENNRTMRVYGFLGHADYIIIRDHGKLVEWYKFFGFKQAGLIDVSHLIPPDLKPATVVAYYIDRDQVIYEDDDYKLILDKYPDGSISNLLLKKGKITLNKITFDRTGESKVEFDFYEPTVEKALSELKYGKVIERRGVGKKVITIK